jgi:hypothetical protein
MSPPSELSTDGSLGIPELDLLAAFGPFLVTTFCLCMTVRTLAGESTSTKG